MTLEQAIAAFEDPNVHSIVTDPGELKGWLIELKEKREQIAEYDKLLKSAAKIINSFQPCDFEICSECINGPDGHMCNDYDYFEWIHKNTGEYKKLMGEQNDENN